MSTATLPPGFDASQPHVLLVDLSHFEPDSDFHALADAGIQGVITKCTEGTSMVDPLYDVFRKKAAAVAAEHGFFAFGGYHFFRPELDPVVQARYFLAHATPKPGDIMPTLDSETDGESVGLRSLAFAQQVYKALNRYPILYTGNSFYRDRLSAHFDGHCPLWVARYGAKPQTPCAIWQWSEAVRLPGQPRAMDADVFYGDLAAFKATMLLR